MATAKKRSEGPTVIKKYANRRLYDTGRSSYVTLEDLGEMVKEGHDFVVYDAKTGEDLTRSVLTQIIVEEEQNEGQSLLPIGFLRQLIGFYGDGLAPLVPNYLEHTIQTFAKNQEQLRQQINKSIEGMFPVPNLEEINKQNMAMFENAMRMFRPFGTPPNNKDDK
jgi:polyhydroxyalkanoate synthesis repressor PhaR